MSGQIESKHISNSARGKILLEAANDTAFEALLGRAKQAGDIYWNTALGKYRIWNGSRYVNSDDTPSTEPWYPIYRSEILDVQSITGEPYQYGMCSNDKYLAVGWDALVTWPAMRIDKRDFTTTAVVTITGTRGYTAVSDGVYVYFPHHNGKISRLPWNDWQIGVLSQLDLTATDPTNLSYRYGTYNNGFIYIVQYGYADAKIVKIDIKTFTVSATLDIGSYDPHFASVNGIITDGIYLYMLGGYSVFAPTHTNKIMRVNIATFSIIDVFDPQIFFPSPSSGDNYGSIVSDGRFIYVSKIGSFTWRASLPDFLEVYYIDALPIIAGRYSLEVTGKYIYIGGTIGGKASILRVDKSNYTVDSTGDLESDNPGATYYKSFHSDGTHLYMSSDASSNGKMARISTFFQGGY